MRVTMLDRLLDWTLRQNVTVEVKFNEKVDVNLDVVARPLNKMLHQIWPRYWVEKITDFSCRHIRFNGLLFVLYKYSVDIHCPRDYCILAQPYQLIILTVAFQDYMTYWMHRIFHMPYLYRRFHRMHHKYVQPTAFSVTAIHPVEISAIQVVMVVPIFTVPIHWGMWITCLHAIMWNRMILLSV